MITLQRFALISTRNLLFKTFSSSQTAINAVNEKTGDKIVNVKNTPKKTVQRGSLVETAFASLKNDQDSTLDPFLINEQKISFDEKILNAKTVAGLLSLSETNEKISRYHALKIVSILAEWSTIEKVKLSEFENDPRFVKLCRILGRAPIIKGNNNVRNGDGLKKVNDYKTDDLNTVLGVTGDDEAAKLISSISLPQMVKVMSTLTQKKRRSTPLLRSLAYNISSNSTILNIKQCGDVLYSLAKLNFPDPVLIGRICTDLHSGLEKNDKSAVVGSILTSLGLLKYRDLDALEALTDWVIKNVNICRPQDISALFLTLASLNYSTTKSNILKEQLIDSIVEVDLKKTTDWLDHVWALVLLNFAKPQHIQSVLSEEYLSKLISLTGNDLTPTTKMKLLNINASAKFLLNDYKGTFLDNPLLYDIPFVYSKSKQALVGGMLDALKSLISSHSNIKTHVDTKMGFVIDAVCMFDEKGSPVSGDKLPENTKKVAIMVQDYHDFNHGSNQVPVGSYALSLRLLEKNNYLVLTIPYSEFNTSEKLLKRVQYLEEKLKKILNIKTNQK